MDSTPRDDGTPWWGTYELEEETGGRWDVGPSTLWLYRTGRDWRVIHRPSAYANVADSLVSRSAVTLPIPTANIEDILAAETRELEVRRYGFRRTGPGVTLRPVLADRPVVARPEHPLYVPPGEVVTLYLSSAVWVRIELPERGHCLQEVPTHRMSDTWFGTSTRDGTFCYATRTAGRLRLDRLPQRPHRAVTPLRVRNEADDPLALERVQLPAPYLTVFRAASHMLWTNMVTMKRTAAEEGAAVTVSNGPPPKVPGAERIQDPREADQKGLFTSTFSAVGALFSA